MQWEEFSSVSFAILIALVVGGCNSTSPLPAADAILVGIDVIHLSDHGTAPRLVLSFENQSAMSVVFSDTFGYGAFDWAGVRIRDSNGEFVPYPVDADLFHIPPRQCLRPGETISWLLDLQHWNLRYGGKIVEEHEYGFNLQPGAYEVQALYTSSKKAKLKRCTPLSGVSESPWRSFTVK